MAGQPFLPKPEIRGVGYVLYRCAKCGELMEPTEAVVIANLSYHLDHQPKESDGR